MTPPACPCRDSCPCHGPVPICLHGYYGPLVGRPSVVAAADGSDLTVYLVTADDCRGCPAGTPGPTTPNPPEARP